MYHHLKIMTGLKVATAIIKRRQQSSQWTEVKAGASSSVLSVFYTEVERSLSDFSTLYIDLPFPVAQYPGFIVRHMCLAENRF
jgi:hypothetical protein